VAALAVFLVLATEIMITGGRPYDAGQLRDFHLRDQRQSGTAMVLLLYMSVTTAVLGAAGAVVARRRS
jgi:hypothetical protein